MLVVRSVFQAKYGRGGELVALLKESQQQPTAAKYAPMRILTDASGPFFTVVTESEFPNLAEFERMQGELFKAPEFGEWFARMVPLVESGSREFYNVES